MVTFNFSTPHTRLYSYAFQSSQILEISQIHIKHIVVVACKLTYTWYRVYGKSPREAMWMCTPNFHVYRFNSSSLTTYICYMLYLSDDAWYWTLRSRNMILLLKKFSINSCDLLLSNSVWTCRSMTVIMSLFLLFSISFRLVIAGKYVTWFFTEKSEKS